MTNITLWLAVGMFLYAVVAVYFVVIIARHSKQWAINLQRRYVRGADELIPGLREDFKGKFMQRMFQAGYIFLAIIFALAGFSILFGPICLGDQLSCSALYGQNYIGLFYHTHYWRNRSDALARLLICRSRLFMRP